MTDPLPRPFLKWAGGKGKMLDSILPLLPEVIEDYHEPFLGGGAVFFALRRAGRIRGTAHLSDVNEELIDCYLGIRDDVDGVIKVLKRHVRRNSEEHYRDMRNCAPRTLTARAARTIYLNKTCFNGLYRVNSSGAFNVPYAKYKNPTILDERNLRAASAALQGVTLRAATFETTILHVKERPSCVVYFDPPYVPVTKTSFKNYDRTPFGTSHHQHLVDLMKTLRELGVTVLASNSDCAETRRLYEEFRVHEVLVRRSINCDGKGRGAVTDLLIQP